MSRHALMPPHFPYTTLFRSLVTLAAGAIHSAVLWLVEVAALYLSLRFLATAQQVSAIEASLRAGDVVGAAERLAQWQGEPLEAPDAGSVSRLAAEHTLREAHHGTFGPLFWFLVLPGPIGLAPYPLAPRAAQSWEYVQGSPADWGAAIPPDERDFG